MTSAVGSSLLVLLLAATGYCNPTPPTDPTAPTVPTNPTAPTGHEFRFDYEFDELANGWLKYHVIPATWNEANMRCHAEGAVLASPLTAELKAAIVTFVKKHTPPYEEETVIFSGVHATYSKGDYSSVEGVPLLRLAITWAPGEPNNYKNLESCLIMDTVNNGTMADVPCGNVLPYVCYKQYTPLIVTECGTTDPGYILSPATGSCYKFHREARIWSEAYMTCAAEGGYLAIVNSPTEAAVIDSFAHAEVSLLGFHDVDVHHNFVTIHGQTLVEAGYDKWQSGEPNNVTYARVGDDGEHCGAIRVSNGKLGFNDMPCHLPTPFMCEMRPNSLR